MAHEAMFLWPGPCMHHAHIGVSTSARRPHVMLGLDATPISRPNSCSRQRRVACCKQWRRHVGAAAGGTSAGTASGSPFTDLMQAIQAQLQQQAPDSEPPSTEINVQNLCYHPAGTLFLAIKKGPDDRSVDDISATLIISCSLYLMM